MQVHIKVGIHVMYIFCRSKTNKYLTNKTISLLFKTLKEIK